VLGDRFLIAERSIAVDDETRVAAQYQVPHDPQTGLPDSHGATVAPSISPRSALQTPQRKQGLPGEKKNQ
jgi:hypothetical protein